MAARLKFDSARAMRMALGTDPKFAEQDSLEGRFGFYVWETPQLEGFELPPGRDLIISLHLLGSRNIRAITGGGISRLVSEPGLLTIIPPGVKVAFRAGGERIKAVTLHLPQRRSKGANKLLAPRNPLEARFAFHDVFASACMEALHRASINRRPGNSVYFTKIIDALLLHLEREAVPADLSIADGHRRLGRRSVEELLRFIDLRMGTKLGIDELASLANLSRSTFTREFRSIVGLSFHAYLTERRIVKSKKMLRETKSSLSHIAQETGFSSQSHFASAFKALEQSTPMRYRREMNSDGAAASASTHYSLRVR